MPEYEPIIGPPAPDVNSAASSTAAQVHFDRSNNRMLVKGLEIGVIDHSAGSNKCVSGPDDNDSLFYKEMEFVVTLLHRSRRDDVPKVLQIGDDVRNLLQVGSCLLFDSRQTIRDQDGKFIALSGEQLLNVIVAVHDASPNFRSSFSDAFTYLIYLCFFKKPRDDPRVDRPPDVSIVERLRAEMTQKVRRNYWDRTWIRNDRFDALGLAPAAARQGDLLFIPYGCPFVMAFRENEDGTFIVVGPCWLYGFMHGDAIRMHADGVLSEREVVLV